MPRRLVPPNAYLALLSAWFVALVVGCLAPGRAVAAQVPSESALVAWTHGEALSLPDDEDGPTAVVTAPFLLKSESDADASEPQTSWVTPTFAGIGHPTIPLARYTREVRLQAVPAGLVVPSSRRVPSSGARAPPIA